MEYSFNLILAFLFGIFIKIYDDIIDNKLNINIFYINFIKYFMITLFSIIFYNSFGFTILIFISSFISFLIDKYYVTNLTINKDNITQKYLTCMNDDIWIYLSILSGCFVLFHSYCFLQKNKLNEINLLSIKNKTFFINIIILFIVILCDMYFFPEENSNKKILGRIVLLILLSIFFYYMTFYSEYIYEASYGSILFFIGCSIISICFLTLDKYKYFDCLKNKSDVI